MTLSTILPIECRRRLRSSGMPDRLVERLVVNVVQAPSSDGSRLDGSGESARDQAGNELSAVLAASGTRERAVLAFQEAAGVDHDGDKELTLALGEAEAGEGVHAAVR